MKHELMQLPYERDSLEPYMSQETLDYHYGKHHQWYVNTLNDLIVGTQYEDMSLEDIVKKSEWKIFNNAAQIWNHNLFWNTLKKDSSLPEGKLKDMIEESFGSLEEMKAEFKKQATGQFGSGWAWLCVHKGGKLEICSTPNQDNSLMPGVGCGGHPILGLDVWEHAYYLNYQNKRPDYIEAFFNLINWKEVAKLYAANK